MSTCHFWMHTIIQMCCHKINSFYYQQKLNNELDAILENQPRLDAKMSTLQNVMWVISKFQWCKFYILLITTCKDLSLTTFRKLHGILLEMWNVTSSSTSLDSWIWGKKLGKSYLVDYLIFSPNLQLVMRDAQHLHTMISNTSDLAEKVSSKVRLLDLVKVCHLVPLPCRDL